MTFNQVMELVRTVSSHAAFEDPECACYYSLLDSLPEQALVVEVGLQFGRSSAVALQVCKAKNLRYIGIDSFEEDNDASAKWVELAKRVGVPYTLWYQRSNDVVVAEPIDLVLIDGDHSYQGVLDDLNHFGPLVREGGYLCCHDYGRDSLPDVYKAVTEYMTGNPQWVEHQHVGTLCVWRRA